MTGECVYTSRAIDDASLARSLARPFAGFRSEMPGCPGDVRDVSAATSLIIYGGGGGGGLRRAASSRARGRGFGDRGRGEM